MRTERLLKTLYLLLEKGRMTAAQMAQANEVSVRTVYRDLEALAVAGFPVCAVRGRGGGMGVMEGFTQAEKDLLLQAVSGFRQADPEVAQTLLHKLRALFEQPVRDWMEIDLSRWWEPEPGPDLFDTVKAAILARRQLKIQYCSSTSGTALRQVCPVKLVYRHSAWYVQAYCLKARGYRQFKLTRILGVERTDQPFPGGLGPAPAFQAGPEGKPVRLVLIVPESLAFRVYDEFGAGQVSQQADGSLLVSVRVPEGAWLISYLLSFLGAVKVLEPPEIKAAMARAAHEVLDSLEIS